MRTTIAVILTVIATVFFALTAAGALSEASFGLTTVPAANACSLIVTGVAAAGPAPELRAGDTIDARMLSAHERIRLMVPRASDAMMLPMRHAGAAGPPAMVMAVPAPRAAGDAAYAGLTLLLVLMLLGLYVLWRGRDTASLGLGTFFAMIPAFFLSHAYAALPDQAIVAVLFLAAFLNVLGYVGLYVMVDALAAPALTPMFRRSGWFGTAGLLAVAGLILCSSTFGRVFTGCPPLVNVQIVVACYATVIALCFLLLWRGMTAPERSAERGRLRWVFWATVVGFSGPLVSFAFISAGRPLPFGGIVNLSFLAVPLGYTYAVLRHRVIDVGFVLNRALSLTILTSGLVILFIIIESLLERFAIGNAESTFVQVAVSLGLGMLFNKVHGWLERRLERLLFRRRYALEESLRRLVERIDACSDEDALIADVVTSLRATLALRGCTFHRAADDFEPDGESLSFPIGVGRIRYGAIVLQEDPRAEAFASEEMSLLRTLARHVSAAIAALRAEHYERFVKGTP